MSDPRRRSPNFYYDKDGNPIPFKSTNASVGAAAAARAQGYSSPELDLSGNLKSIMGPDGQRVDAVNGKTPEQAETDRVRSQVTNGNAPATTSSMTTSTPSRPTGASVVLNRPTDASVALNRPTGAATALSGAPSGGFPAKTTAPAPTTAAPSTTNNVVVNPDNPFGSQRTLTLGGTAQPTGNAPAPAPTTNNAPAATAGQPGASGQGPLYHPFGVVNMGRGAGVEGDGLPHDVAVVANAARQNQPALPPGTYGKIFQTDPTHEVGAGETAFVNGKPVAPGQSVTFTGPGSNSAVVQPTYHPGEMTARLAGTSATTATPPAAPGSVTSAPGSPLLKATALPTPNFAGNSTLGGFGDTPLAGAPALKLGTGAPAPATPPTPPFAASTTLPASTVAGSTIRADDIRTPQAPAQDPGLAAGQSARTAVNNFLGNVTGGTGDAITGTVGKVATGVTTGVNAVRGFLGDTSATPTAKDAGMDFDPATGALDANFQRTAPVGLMQPSDTAPKAPSYDPAAKNALAGALASALSPSPGAPLAAALGADTGGLYHPQNYAAPAAAPVAPVDDPTKRKLVTGPGGMFGGFSNAAAA